MDVLKNFPDESINCVVTSPPYWSLRDYHLSPVVWGGDKSCEHEWENASYMRRSSDEGGNKNRWSDETFEELRRDKPINHASCRICGAWSGSLGLEPTYEMFISNLVTIFDEIKRVLRKNGTCWVNLGDTFASTPSGAKTIKYDGDGVWGRLMECNTDGGEEGVTPKPKDYGAVQRKSLVMIPFRFAIAMVDNGWILRNTIIWHKPNQMPQNARDRFTVNFEYLFFFTKSKRYWFDQQFEASVSPESYVGRRPRNPDARTQTGDVLLKNNFHKLTGKKYPMRNRRAIWKIPAKAFPGHHFAVFPPELVETPINAGCPQWICKKCGKPRERLQSKAYHNTRPGNNTGNKKSGTTSDPNKLLHSADLSKYRQQIEYQTTGWTDCGCNAGWKQGVVLDPFMGAGTTAVVAQQLKRNWIGIELSQKYIDMAYKRLSETQFQQKYSDAIVDTEQKPHQTYLF